MNATVPEDRFAYHRARPEVSVAQYARLRSIELGALVSARKRVYLDKCFWIQLRDATLDTKLVGPAVTLLGVLHHEVSEGRLICPISDALFLELMKQTDQRTRRATAVLIDKLSLGVALVPHFTRVATEVAHLLHQGGGHALDPLEHLIWTKAAYVLGMQHPVASAFPASERLVIQKAFLDHLWTVPLASILDKLDDAQAPKLTYPALAERLNRENAQHVAQMRSFAQVYRDEVDGVMELAAQIGVDVLNDMATRSAGRPLDVASVEKDAATQEVLGFLRAVVRKPMGRSALRTLHIGATLHAALRWNRSQKLDANDLYDFHHAEAALSYCNFFLHRRSDACIVEAEAPWAAARLHVPG